MDIQFNSRNGATARERGRPGTLYLLTCIPWKDGSGKYYMWNIIRKEIDEDDMIDIEVYCQDISILKLETMFQWLIDNDESTPDEISQYIKKTLSCRKCNVYKVTIARDGSYEKILEQSRGADTPELKYPGTRSDELN